MKNIDLNQQLMGRCIRVQMARNDLTVADIADKMGVTRMTANHYKNGKVNDIRKIARLCNMFGVTFDQLFEI